LRTFHGVVNDIEPLFAQCHVTVKATKGVGPDLAADWIEKFAPFPFNALFSSRL